MTKSTIVLLTSLFLISLASATVPTELNVTNTPPILIQNFSDTLIIMDTANIHVFDLDDYFMDPNGDEITWGYSPLNNVTITIDSENRASFYPDIGYSGTQSMIFNATDAAGTVTSNSFLITVGLDTTPPQPSSPKKSVISIYQNYQVTFTTKWTDNTELKDFIFSINQGLGWQNQTLTEMTGSSNTSSFRIQISAQAGTNVSWTFYARDIYDNIGKLPVRYFTVKEYTIVPGEEYEGEEYEGEQNGSEKGDEVSYGTEETKLDYFDEGILAENLEVDTRHIKVTLKQGENITKVVKIINTGQTSITLNASILKVGDMTRLEDTIITISPGETHELAVDFSIPKDKMPDQYFGFLNLNYGERISIPIVIDVKEFESEVEIKVNLTRSSKTVTRGEDVTALIRIKNLKDITSENSQLYYALKNFNGIIIESKYEDIILPALFEEERSLTVPESTKNGEYIFYARIISGESIDLDSEAFLVGMRFKVIAFIKLFLYPLLILLLLLIILILYIIHKRNKKKKRLLELYLLLNELRSLVKAGKTKEAVEIYKRIKVTYGQHVPKEFLKNEEKLKQELEKFSKELEKSAKVQPVEKKNAENKEEKPEPNQGKSPEIEKKKEPQPTEPQPKPTTPEKPKEPAPTEVKSVPAPQPKPQQKPTEPKPTTPEKPKEPAPTEPKPETKPTTPKPTEPQPQPQTKPTQPQQK
jgi:hypothetical protein